jgi:hypothetical protein
VSCEQDHAECSHNHDQCHDHEFHWPPSRSRAIAGLLEGDPRTLDWGSLASRIHRRLCAAERSSASSPLLRCWEEVETHDRRSSLVGGCDTHGPTSACLAIRSSVGCALIIHLLILTILLDSSGAIRTDEASNVSRLDPSGADQADAEHPTRSRKVAGSNPTSRLKTQQLRTR